MDTTPSDASGQAPQVPQENLAAIELIRNKVNASYQATPSETQTTPTSAPASKHQRFMQELQSSGKSLAEVQTAWHEYYMALPDEEKHEVWQEFYSSNQHSQYQQVYGQAQTAQSSQTTMPTGAVQTPLAPQAPIAPEGRLLNMPGRLVGVKPIQRKPKKTKPPATGFKSYLQSLWFGLSIGGLVLLILLFTFFNEFIIAPFIQPSRVVSAGPIIMTNNSVATGTKPMVTISKINVQAPIDFTLTTNDEAAIQEALKGGIVHYAGTAFPGQNGNAAFFGHSSRNVFAGGEYGFAFAVLHNISEGDVFNITYNDKIYSYRVFAKEIISPTQVEVLDDTKGKQATAILVTCNPPGFNVNRLVVWGEQISPSPSSNTAPASVSPQEKPKTISSNSTRLWDVWLKKLQFWKD